MGILLYEYTLLVIDSKLPPTSTKSLISTSLLAEYFELILMASKDKLNEKKNPWSMILFWYFKFKLHFSSHPATLHCCLQIQGHAQCLAAMIASITTAFIENQRNLIVEHTHCDLSYALRNPSSSSPFFQFKNCSCGVYWQLKHISWYLFYTSNWFSSQEQITRISFNIN